MECQTLLSPCIDRSCFGVNDIFEKAEWSGESSRQTTTHPYPLTYRVNDRSYKASLPSRDPATPAESAIDPKPTSPPPPPPPSDPPAAVRR